MFSFVELIYGDIYSETDGKALCLWCQEQLPSAYLFSFSSTKKVSLYHLLIEIQSYMIEN